MIIRNFEEPDRNAVIALWQACDLTRPWNDPHQDIDRKMQYQPELFFVGIENNAIIASAMAGYDGHRGSVFYLAISPQKQGNGYGKKMMHHLENTLRAIGCPKINIAVRTTNVPVLAFYNRQGYSKDDVVIIAKRLITDKNGKQENT